MRRSNASPELAMNQIVRNTAASPVAARLVRTGFWHEAATCIVEREDRTVVYGGAGERSGALYKFVTHDACEDGALYVARFEADAEEDGIPVAFGEHPLAMENGRVTWRPVTFGQGPLTAINGFADQTDVLAELRRAATLLGATRMDLLQEVTASPQAGTVRCDLADHVIEIAEADDDFSGLRGHWEVLFTRGGR